MDKAPTLVYDGGSDSTDESSDLAECEQFEAQGGGELGVGENKIYPLILIRDDCENTVMKTKNEAWLCGAPWRILRVNCRRGTDTFCEAESS